MDATTVNFINQITLATAAIIACGVLWRAYKSAHDEAIKAKDLHISDMKEVNKAGIFDLRARTMVLEDRAGVDRKSRFDYMPPMSDQEKIALDDLGVETPRRFDDKTSENSNRSP